MTRTKNNFNIEREAILNELIDRFEGAVRHFTYRALRSAVCDEEDLLQAGRLAIIESYEKYDPSKGATLETWIYDNIEYAILTYQYDNLSHLSGGDYVAKIMTKIRKEGNEVTMETLMDKGVSYATAVAAIHMNMQPATYGECFNMIDRNAVQPFANMECYRLSYADYLTEKETDMIEQYFGFTNDRSTMIDIGEGCGKSRKAVSYAINKAIVKLRHVPGIEAHYEKLTMPR